jgi:hypothetical protein
MERGPSEPGELEIAPAVSERELVRENVALREALSELALNLEAEAERFDRMAARIRKMLGPA